MSLTNKLSLIIPLFLINLWQRTQKALLHHHNVTTNYSQDSCIISGHRRFFFIMTIWAWSSWRVSINLETRPFNHMIITLTNLCKIERMKTHNWRLLNQREWSLNKENIIKTRLKTRVEQLISEEELSVERAAITKNVQKEQQKPVPTQKSLFLKRKSRKIKGEILKSFKVHLRGKNIKK